MALFDYIKLKIQAVFFRTFVSIISFLNPPSRIFYPKSKSIKPTWSTTIPSTSSSRKIRVNIHEPPNLTSSASLPGVHLNFHGSGFVLDMFGGDAEHLTYLAETVGCIVVDGDYAKGPEYPFPAAFNDVNDIVNWAKSNPLGKWDPSKLTIGGYSAGANLAISVTAAALPSKDIKAVVAWYPPIDFPRRDLPSERQRYKEHKPEYPGTDLPKNVTDFFDGCYIGKGDKRDPKISPYLADLTGFPPTFVTVGDTDILSKESEEFAAALKKVGGESEFVLVKNAGHSWERMFKDEAYRAEALAIFERIVKFLNRVHRPRA